MEIWSVVKINVYLVGGSINDSLVFPLGSFKIALRNQVPERLSVNLSKLN